MGKGILITAGTVIALMGIVTGTSATPLPTNQSIEGNRTVQLGKEQIEVSGRLGFGRIWGESRELVYEKNRKVSELIWPLDNVYMLNAGVSVQPSSWLKLNADIWFAVSNGGGKMDDYDWTAQGMDWTHWSHDEDTPLDRGIMFDINAEIPFYHINRTTFSAFLGLKQDNWKWNSYGGSYIYSHNAFRDSTGTFPDDELGISYEQWWTVPYIGLGFASSLSNWDFSGRLIASPFVQGRDEDMHHLRNLFFEEDFDNSFMWSIDLAANYKIDPQWGIIGAFKYQYYQEALGTTTMTNMVTGEQVFFGGDAAGGDNRALLLTLSLDYQF
ncbi:omptin family outer membrane protease [Desulfotalea psychrophila]|uniref:Related to outer membrane protease n=1 Tax=Desulfotalea psychrophila (strain LSv54 / DSM 12343) TaxID=177439 RepID=Q6AJP9_DESPS|nr:omptin family outer membrane protease [Desulfotalea psychrophila]CAG37431.1 related to outer membrane protease [Desulfotalea psychrophila LSv54]